MFITVTGAAPGLRKSTLVLGNRLAGGGSRCRVFPEAMIAERDEFADVMLIPYLPSLAWGLSDAEIVELFAKPAAAPARSSCYRSTSTTHQRYQSRERSNAKTHPGSTG